MSLTHRSARLLSLALALHLAGCQEDNFNDLRPDLIITPGNPTDSADHYVLDFGSVPVDSTVTRSITITDQSAAPLILQPADVAAPFGVVITDVQTIAPHDALVIGFTYKPAELGASAASVTLVSNSVDAGVINRIVDLQGIGVVPPPAGCTFAVLPTAVDFGSVAAGQTTTSGVRVMNTGTVSCPVTAIQVATGSSPAFTLASGQATSTTVTVGSSIPLGVTFAPVTSSGTFQGTLDFSVAGTVVKVPLSGTSPAPVVPCTSSVTPTSIGFGIVQVNATMTSGVVVKNTGSVACSITDILIGVNSDTAFALATGQASTGMLAAGATMTIEVTFAPLDASQAYQGTLTFDVSGAAVTVPLHGATPGGCPNPNANGTCGSATAPVYVNSDTALYTFDPATDTVTHVTNFAAGGDLIYDIAIDTNGVLLGTAESGSLYTINVGTGECTAVGSNGIAANAMTVTIDNQIVIAGGSDVQIIDRTTYAITETLVSNSAYTSSGDIVALPDGYLYWSVMGSANDRLVKIDRTTGATTLVGTLPDRKVWGLAYAASTLFGFSVDTNYLVIDPTNATGTTGSAPDTWYGATSNPVVW